MQYGLQKCSVRSVTELTVRQAREMLAAWAAEQDAVGSRRDEVVRAAVDAGLSKSEAHRLTGIGAVCVAIARPYALGIPGRARHDARVSGTAGLRFRTIAVIPGPSRHERKRHC